MCYGRRMRALVFVLLAAGAPLACASLKSAEPGDGDGRADAGHEYDASPSADASPTPADGAADGATKTGDPRWPLWKAPADAPANTDYAIANGSDGAIVNDKITGLAWQDAVPSTTRDFDGATAYCDALVYDGFKDWRLPTRIEAVSIMSFKPVFDDTAMAGPAFSAVAGAQCFWTASTFVKYPASAWKITPASVDFADRTSKCAARCVRGGPTLGAPIAKQYDLIDADMLRDPVTHLVWERTPPAAQSMWDVANARCQALALGGRPWRLPSVKELASIVDETKSGPASNGSFGDSAARTFTANPQWTVNFDQGIAVQGPTGFAESSRCVSPQ